MDLEALCILGNKLQNVGSTEQFIETFKRNVKPEDVSNIKELFDSVEFTLPQTVEALHFYTAIHCHFSDVFVHELLRCRHLFGESSDVSIGAFMERHCRGAMITHCYIVENLDSMVLVDQILNAVASGHVFLSKLSLSIKVELQLCTLHFFSLFIFYRNTMRFYTIF